MPMLDVRRNVDDIPWAQLTSWLALFLIPSTTSRDQQHLPAALIGVVNVPVVATSRLEGDVTDHHLLRREHVEIAPAREVLSETIVGPTCGKRTELWYIL